MEIEQWAIERVIPYSKNPRINDDAVPAVAASIREFGFRQPIVVDPDGVIIVGHTRWKAAIFLGLEHVPVHVATDLSEAQVKAYRIADNKVGELSLWDYEVLPEELVDLQSMDFDLDVLGFGADELPHLLGDEEGQTDPDEVPEPPGEAITQPGDLWILGEHRLLCGDATNADDVRQLMDGERACLMNTDPPYGVSYANDDRPNPGVAKPRVAKPRVANDVLEDENLQRFLESAFKLAVDEAVKIDAAWYMWHAHLTQGYFAAAAAAADVVLHRQIIWIKPVLLFGRGQYHWKHEPCFMGWVRGHSPPDYGEGNGERTQTTVWEVDGVPRDERREFNHSTPKPVKLFTIPIVKHTKPGEIVYEPFSGSGPQFIAAEELGRKCYGLEIDPLYCDVIVARWEKFTGKKAERQVGQSA